MDAEDYDELIRFASLPPDTDATVAGLAELARGGRVLELGVGTGRVAIPLAATGLELHGIELDPAMVAQLRAKPGGEGVHVWLGDMAELDVDGDFDLIYVVFGTLFLLATQDDQVRCFANVARHLTTDGRFVVEALLPRPEAYTDDRRVGAVHAGSDRVVVNVSRHDPLAQTVETHQVLIGASGVRIVPIRIRYSWPSELDLMARLAGLQPVGRWGDWNGRPFTVGDQRHISIYGPAAT